MSREARSVKRSDIAVIGMAARFPGAFCYRQYWDNLTRGAVSIRTVPSERWKWEDWFSESQFEPGRCNSRWGGFIDDVDTFDGKLFRMSRRQLEHTDPQQRLALELAWSCLEDAGISPVSVSGSAFGVFIAVLNSDYKEVLDRAVTIGGYYQTGVETSVIPNRISYCFDLRGPSVAINSACAGSLHAIHAACSAIQGGECEAALAGGISLLLTPTYMIGCSQMGMLSPSGLLRPFDDGADGTILGEGGGILLLKSAHQAEHDGNRIIGIIRGTAVGHSGRTSSLSMPNAAAQAAVIRRALSRAEVDARTVTYVEAHGTGTPTGDPIELAGLVETVGKGNIPCGIGSVKANIGHLLAAAGVAGVIKVLLAMENESLPPTPGFARLNSRCSLENTRLFVLNQPQRWRPVDGDGRTVPQIAGISGFGFAGTNAHVIISAARQSRSERGRRNSAKPKAHNNRHNQRASCIARDRRSIVITLSADTHSTLQQYAAELATYLAQHPLTDSDLDRIAYTLQTGRGSFAHRLAMQVTSIPELVIKLKEYASIGHASGVFVSDREVGQFGDGQTRDSCLDQICRDWVSGGTPNWSELYTPGSMRPVSLPTYPFERTRYWID